MAKGYKLFLIGEKEPMLLSKKEGEEVDRIFSDSNVPEAAVISLEGNQSFRKKEIKKIFPFTVQAVVNTPSTYDKETLVSIQKELEPYKIQEYSPETLRYKEQLIKAILDRRVPLFYSPEVKIEIESARNEDVNPMEAKIIANRLFSSYYVGKVFREGEERFMVDKGLVKVDQYGNWIYLQMADGSVPAAEMIARIGAWRESREKQIYASKMETTYIDKLVAGMSI